MTAVCGFARYLSGIDTSTQVPPLGLMPSQRRWRPPFIFCPADIAVVLGQVRESIFAPLYAAAYDTLIGLLAVSGLRIGEAIKLPLSKYAVLRDELTATAQGSELLRLPEAQAAALRRHATDLPAAHRHRRDRGGSGRNVAGQRAERRRLKSGRSSVRTRRRLPSDRAHRGPLEPARPSSLDAHDGAAGRKAWRGEDCCCPLVATSGGGHGMQVEEPAGRWHATRQRHDLLAISLFAKE